MKLASTPQSAAHIMNLYQMIEQASDGSVITIPTGEYYLDKPLELNKNVNLIGETGDPADVVICANDGAAIVISAQKARVNSITFTNKTAKEVELSSDIVSSSVVVVNAGESEIGNCVIFGKGDGLTITGSDTAPIIRYCKIRDCTCGGVWIFYNARALLYHCNISHCGHAALAVCSQSAVKALNTEIHHSCNLGAYIYQNSFARFVDCKFHHNVLSGIELRNESDCVCESCEMSSNQEHGICVWGKCNGLFEQCDIHDNSSIQVVSIESQPQFVECKIHESPSVGALFHANSSGQLNSCEIYNTADVAIALSEYSDTLAIDCIIHHSRQAGIMCIMDSHGRFNNCEIFLCNAGGILVAEHSAPTFIDCSIYHNKIFGIQIIDNGSGKFYNNNFFDNGGQNWVIEDSAGEIVREDNSPNW